jgi:tyrosyl-tRNA synthetase
MAISTREAKVRLAASLRRLKFAGRLGDDESDELNSMFSRELATARKSTADLNGEKADELNDLFDGEFVSTKKANRATRSYS